MYKATMHRRIQINLDLINFLIEVLFITNLWIILYTSLLDYLNFLFPPSVNEVFFRNPLANPEPFEISLYIILSVAFLFLIWLYEKYFKPIWDNSKFFFR